MFMVRFRARSCLGFEAVFTVWAVVFKTLRV